MNSCGGCTACCRTVPVKEIGVRAYQACPHVREAYHAAGPGCGFAPGGYANRPYSCKAWSCVWLKSGWPPELRPDRLGIVVDELVDIVKVNGVELPAAQIWVMQGHDDDWERPEIHNIIMSLIDREKLAVLWRLYPGREAIVFLRDPKTKKVMRSPRHVADRLDSLGPDSERLVRGGAMYGRQQQQRRDRR